MKGEFLFMIKGVNRQIVDIPQPESAYFERAIFFVKPEFAALSESKLRKKADEMAKNTAVPPKTKENGGKSKIANILSALLSALAGSGITLLLEMLLK